MSEFPAVKSEETQMSQVDAETTARVIAENASASASGGCG